MKIVAVVLDPIEIARLCNHLGEPAEAPTVRPSRYQAQTEWEWDFVPQTQPPTTTPPGRPPDRPAGDDAQQAPNWDYADPPAPE